MPYHRRKDAAVRQGIRQTCVCVSAMAVVAIGSTAASDAKTSTMRNGGGDVVSPTYSYSNATYCYEQRGDSGEDYVSTDFPRKYNKYDSRGADDFTLPLACTVRLVA